MSDCAITTDTRRLDQPNSCPQTTHLRATLIGRGCKCLSCNDQDCACESGAACMLGRPANQAVRSGSL